VESLPHHLLNKFFLFLQEQEPGSNLQWKSDCSRDDGATAHDALGGAGWDVMSLQSETLVMQNRIIIQVNHKPKLLVEGRIMWMDRNSHPKLEVIHLAATESQVKHTLSLFFSEPLFFQNRNTSFFFCFSFVFFCFFLLQYGCSTTKKDCRLGVRNNKGTRCKALHEKRK